MTNPKKQPLSIGTHRPADYADVDSKALLLENAQQREAIAKLELDLQGQRAENIALSNQNKQQCENIQICLDQIKPLMIELKYLKEVNRLNDSIFDQMADRLEAKYQKEHEQHQALQDTHASAIKDIALLRSRAVYTRWVCVGLVLINIALIAWQAKLLGGI